MQLTGQDARSDRRGITLGLQLSGGQLSSAGYAGRVVPGGGLGLPLGFGISDRISAFVRASSGYRSNQLDVGARYRFGQPSQALRPYVEAAVTRMGAAGMQSDGESGPLRAPGPGVTGGAGVEYSISPRLGVDVGVIHSRGRFDDRLNDAQRGFASTRVHVGVTWRP